MPGDEPPAGFLCGIVLVAVDKYEFGLTEQRASVRGQIKTYFFVILIHILLPVVGHVQPFLLASDDLLSGKGFLRGFLRELAATVESVPIGARREGTGGRTEGYRVGILAQLSVQRNRVRGIGRSW